MANQLLTQIIQTFTHVATSIIWVILIAVISMFLIKRLLKTTDKNPGQNNLTRKQPLTEREKLMYTALTTALPECVVLAQVAFSALIDTPHRPQRNRFDRKVADFILCSPLLNVIAVIELDDRSHLGREHHDRQRDAMLKSVGYTTIRYPQIPTTETIRTDIEKLLTITSQTRQ